MGGYLNVILSEDGVKTSIKVHQLVAIAFLNHKRSGYKNVVNHINFNTLDNNINNLEIVSARENCNKKHIKSSSKYVGVTYKKRDRRWMAQIKIDGVNKYLGYFKNELDASNAYQSALKYYICK